MLHPKNTKFLGFIFLVTLVLPTHPTQLNETWNAYSLLSWYCGIMVFIKKLENKFTLPAKTQNFRGIF